MKINIHSDLFIAPTNKSLTGNAPRVASSSTSGPAASSQDGLSDSASASSIGSTLSDLSSTRAARVSQLAALYASGKYTVDSTKVAQSLVFEAFSISR